MPEDATWDDVMEEDFLKQAIEAGLKAGSKDESAQLGKSVRVTGYLE
ncbi:hypothetical protein [Candidatus Amarobacter glycogenicus]|nr:hypothetical protein [Dehalococcoidia bacterium]